MEKYNEKYFGVDGRLSVLEILQRVGSADYKSAADKEYKAVDIDKVVIDGNTFTNYGQYQFLWEKSFFTQPERSVSGTIENLDSYPTFITPHLILNFSVMSIEDYRKIMKLHYSKNEFVVECYDPIYDDTISVNMYFATEEMAKLYTIAQHRTKTDGSWEEWVDLVGVTDYTVELIGTNSPVDTSSLTVTYVYNNETDSGVIQGNVAKSVAQGSEILVGEGVDFKTLPPAANMTFKHWKDDSGVIYTDGKYITVNSNLTLKAVWQSSNSYVMTFNYGLSKVAEEIIDGVKTEILERDVSFGESIGDLPEISTPTVKIGETIYEPYYAGEWYKTPVIQDNMIVSDDQPYWSRTSTVIYALHAKKPFNVSYITYFADVVVKSQTAYYGDSVYLPTLVKSGYKFDGWYEDEQRTKKFSGKMPPHDLTLHAKWVAE